MTHVFAILVTFQRPTSLTNCLISLASQEEPLHQLIVVDNAPTPEARGLALGSSCAYPVEYLAAPENLGPAGGIATGMRLIEEKAHEDDWVVTLDDDNPPWGPSAISSIHRSADEWLTKDPMTGCVGTGGTRLDRKTGRVSVVSDSQLAAGIQPDSIGGGRFPFYRVAALRSVGEFREDLFFGFEELEYGLRLRSHGFGMHIDPVLRKERGRADGSGQHSKRSMRLQPISWRRYYSIRNLIFILRAYGSSSAARRITALALAKPIANIPMAPTLSTRHLSLATRGCHDAWMNRLGRRVEPELVAQVG